VCHSGVQNPLPNGTTYAYIFGVYDDSKHILTLQLNVIQTFSDVNKCTSCRQIFKHSNTQHIDSGLFIYTDSDMLQ